MDFPVLRLYSAASLKKTAIWGKKQNKVKTCKLIIFQADSPACNAVHYSMAGSGKHVMVGYKFHRVGTCQIRQAPRSSNIGKAHNYKYFPKCLKVTGYEISNFKIQK